MRTPAPDPFRVLFICAGNICRSPYAQYAAARAGLDHVTFDSAGTGALVGAPMCDQMAGLLPPDADPSRHAAKRLSRSLAEDADLIVAMAGEQRSYVLDEWPECANKVFVIGQAAREMASLPQGASLDRLADHLWRHRTSAPGDDVPDPYRRGPEAAATAARRIDRHLGVLLDTLRALGPAAS